MYTRPVVHQGFIQEFESGVLDDGKGQGGVYMAGSREEPRGWGVECRSKTGGVINPTEGAVYIPVRIRSWLVCCISKPKMVLPHQCYPTVSSLIKFSELSMSSFDQM
jgi:hypothetical protein